MDENKQPTFSRSNENISTNLPLYPIYTDIVTAIIVVLRNLWLIIPIVIIGGISTKILLDKESKVYESQASVIIYPQLKPGDDNALLNVVDVMRYNIVGSYAQIIRSRATTTDAIDALKEKYDAEMLKDAVIDVRPIDNSSVIEITIRAEDPEIAQALATAVIAHAIRNSEAIGPIKDIYPLQILDPANLPSSPVAPNMKLGLIIGIIGSLGLGVGAAFALESFKAVKRSQNKLSEADDLKIIQPDNE